MKPSPRAVLIFGISGQVGAYLAKHLIEQGYTIHGTSRDSDANPFTNLRRVGVRNAVMVHSVMPGDFRSVLKVIQLTLPAFIFNLAGQSSVSLSFAQPVDTIDSNMHGTINILEAIRSLGLDTRFYYAASSECFGNTMAGPADETTPFHPRSPMRSARPPGSGRSRTPLRPERYVTRKTVCGAADIAEHKTDHLTLGALNIVRDWGWAPDYVDATTRMLQLDGPEDFVIATGVSVKLKRFIDEVFRAFGLDWTRHVEVDQSMFRPSDLLVSAANPAKAERVLGWSASVRTPELVAKLVGGELSLRHSLKS